MASSPPDVAAEGPIGCAPARDSAPLSVSPDFGSPSALLPRSFFPIGNIAKSWSGNGESDLSKVRLPDRRGPRGADRQRGVLLPTVCGLATLRVRVLAQPRSRQRSRWRGRDRSRAGLYA